MFRSALSDRIVFLSVCFYVCVCVSPSAVCWLQCQNGGMCQRPNTCSCPEGWMGRMCEERKYEAETVSLY